METIQTLQPTTPDMATEVMPIQQPNPNALALQHSQRYRLWQLGVVALTSAETAILRSAQLLEV